MKGMENKNGTPSAGGGRGGLFDQPRKAASGLVFSGAVFGMLVLSLLLSLTLALISQINGTPVGELTQTNAYRYVAYVLYDVAYIAVIAVFLFVYKEKPRAFGFRLPKPQYWLLAVLLAFGLLFSLNFANGWFISFLGLFGYEAPASSLPSLEGAGFIGVLFAVAVLPAFFEETLLCGIILEGIKDVGTVAACLLGGLLFSLFHMSPAQTIYQFICGCVFTLLAIRSQSVFPTMLAHFLNNAVIVLDARFGFLEGISGGGAVAVYVLSALCLIASLVWLTFFDRKTNRKKEGAIKPFLLPAAIGLGICVILWISNFVAGLGG